MKKRNQISEVFNIVVFFWFDKDSPEQNRRIRQSDKKPCTKSFAALPPETNGFAISEKNKLIVELRANGRKLNCLFWTASLV
jgi:hypothetical protein